MNRIPLTTHMPASGLRFFSPVSYIKKPMYISASGVTVLPIYLVKLSRRLGSLTPISSSATAASSEISGGEASFLPISLMLSLLSPALMYIMVDPIAQKKNVLII